MKIRFFGNSDCLNCGKVLISLQRAGVEIEYVDAFADETQDLCDENNVDEIPHLQFIENDSIILEYIGLLEYASLMKILGRFFPNY